jgi:hypothetical protein
VLFVTGNSYLVPLVAFVAFVCLDVTADIQDFVADEFAFNWEEKLEEWLRKIVDAENELQGIKQGLSSSPGMPTDEAEENIVPQMQTRQDFVKAFEADQGRPPTAAEVEVARKVYRFKE